MKTYLLSLCATALFLTACHQDNEHPSVSENVRERQIAFKVMGGDMTLLSNMINGTSTFDMQKLQQQANEFAQHATRPFQYFGEQDQGGNSKPNIWLERHAFDMERDKFLSAVEHFNTAAQAGEFEQIRATFAPVGDSCKSCHDTFKMK